MATLLCIWLLLAEIQTPSAGNGTIEGVVLRADTREPITDAAVSLWLEGPAPKPKMPPKTTTDSSGRFIFKDVVPGGYEIQVWKDGYFDDILWSREPWAADTYVSTRVEVEPKTRLQNVVVTMIPGGMLSGKLVDENGQPAVGAAVHLFTWGYDEAGKPRRDESFENMNSSAVADERGEYRIFGIAPGQYFVEAHFQWRGVPTNPFTFHPNATDDKLATPIAIRAGEETNGINLTVYLKAPTPGATVAGRVTGIPGNSSPVQEILLKQRDDANATWTRYYNEAPNKSGGRFEIRNVPPGTYDLLPEATDSDGRIYTNRAFITVGDRNIQDLAIPVRPGVTLRGRILFNGQPPPRDWAVGNEHGGGWMPDALSLTSENVPEQFLFFDRSPRTADIDAGEFTIANVPAGSYKLRNNYGFPEGSPGDSYLEDIRLNGRSVWAGFEVGDEPVGSLELLVRIPAGRIAGVIRNAAGETAAKATIVLVPEQARQNDPTSYYTERSENGNFALDGIRPGQYTVFAWEYIPERAWLNADYMQRFWTMGQSVSLREGETTTVELRIIPRGR